ncbi:MULTISPECIES: DUF1127 domain-containing protein [Pseudophaeobacter]|jgi:uncharacterized protein YjiS (DUF1127 family)|uniref:DUF1127 domain-containing protein n=1 Tax=Pseudophaeobacter TaxID=1541822 RepID=UPI00242D3034|nr:DUF1127 domain-containing protein [Pseudophaeobacter profundi]
MAHVYNTASNQITLFARLRGLLRDIGARWALARDYKRTFSQLDRLTNRELADIGVRRCDIADIARRHVYEL